MSIESMLAGNPVAAPDSQCSRRGCRNSAVERLLWNNPRIHTPERRKTWLACGEHAEWLACYLSDRGLLRERELMDAATSSADSASTARFDAQPSSSSRESTSEHTPRKSSL